MPLRRNRGKVNEKPSTRPLREMLACAMCGAPVSAVRTSATTLTAVCAACGHLTNAQNPVESGGE